MQDSKHEPCNAQNDKLVKFDRGVYGGILSYMLIYESCMGAPTSK
jgi:hypothetical protein